MRDARLARFRAVIILLLVPFLAGCPLPNAAPFADATGQLKTAVSSSGFAVQDALARSPGGQEQAEQFAKDWKARNDAMTALVNYANSLNNIVSAGNSGSETFGKIADSVTSLANAAGIVVPGAGVVGVVTSAGKLIGEKIAQIRAANDLATAMESAQPAIETIAEKLRQDLQAMDEIVQAAASKVDTVTLKDPDFSQARNYRNALLKEIAKHQDASNNNDRALVAELSKLLADVEARLSVFQAKLDQNDQRLRAARQLISATVSSVDAWSAAHAQLAVAARTKSTVSATALVDAAVQVRDLVKRMREL